MKKFTSPTQRLGEIGEEKAAAYLEKEGFAIIDRNVNGRYGEIDIIASKGNMHYFFEVKAGRANSWMNPAENLTKKKLGKFLKSVEYYCLTHGIRDYRVEGMVVLIAPKEEATIERIELF